jgi:ABC-type nitrate/sulfonate/bicarbonate transport system substrate-binding protein
MASSTNAAVRNLVIAGILMFGFVVVGLAFRFLVYPLLESDVVQQTSATSKYSDEVTINLDSFSGYAVFRSERFRTELKQKGIRVSLVDDGADYSARLKALDRGKADMAVFTIDAFLAAGATHGTFPGTMVMVIDETAGADAIVARKDQIPNLQALGDASFVLTPDSPSEFLARVAIAEFGLGNTNFEEADGSGDVYKRLKKAKGKKAYVLWEPHRTKALADPDVHVLFDTSQVSGYVVDVLVARREFLLDEPDLVRAVLEAHLRSLSHYENDLVSMVMDDAEAVGDDLDRKSAKAVVDGIHWRNTLDNYTHFGLAPKAPGVLHLEDAIANISSVLVRTGKLSTDPADGKAHELFYPGVLDTMKQSDFHPNKGLGIASGGPGTDSLTLSAGNTELASLSDKEWGALTPVGALQVESITFGRGGARLNVQSQRELSQLSRRLASLPRMYLTVRGHTRAEGDLDANRALASDRASAALDFLVDQGVNRNRLRAVAADPQGTGGAFQSVSFVLAQQPY